MLLSRHVLSKTKLPSFTASPGVAAVMVCRINSQYATNGPHNVSAATTKGDLALVFIASANDKQVR
jgi:hypothetical protein